MKLLLVTDSCDARTPLRRLLDRSGHTLRCHSAADVVALQLERFDLVLIDGDAGGCRAEDRLGQSVRQMRERCPHLPLMLVSRVNADNDAGGEEGGSCGIVATADRVWHLNCRLRRLACAETGGLLRPPGQDRTHDAITFEYQG